jgi:hypothetical protein
MLEFTSMVSFSHRACHWEEQEYPEIQSHSMIESSWSHSAYIDCMKPFAMSSVKPGSDASYITLSTASMTCFGPSQAGCKPSSSTSHISRMR